MEVGNIGANQMNQIAQASDLQVGLGEQENRGVAENWQTLEVGAQPEVDGRAALDGAQVRPLAEELRASVPARHSLLKSLAGVGTAVGRAIMKACHAIYNAFTGVESKKHLSEFDDEMRKRFESVRQPETNARVMQTGEDEYALSNGTSMAKRDVVSYTDEEIGAALGLKGRTHVKPFDESEINKIANGDFHLEDIKQDPNLQDCWFLSSLTSVLSFKGANYLKSLITIPQVNNGGQTEDAKFALVKLGFNTYQVPLGDLVDKGGDTGTSSSKAWVRLFETAMQMHMLALSRMDLVADTYSFKVDMNGLSPRLALGALLGKETIADYGDLGRTLNDGVDCTFGATVTEISNALQNKRPVVLSSLGGIGASLKYGLSPNHAVSVQAVVPDEHSNRTFIHVIDPYGRSVVMDASVLNGATVFIA